MKKLYPLLHRFYYAFVFGRQVPLASGLGSAVRRYEIATDQCDIPAAKETWEAEYSAGRWEYMKYLDEFPRYSMIAGYFQELKPGGSILDVGCGEGILRQRLAGGFDRYVGVDVSETAIGRSPKEDEKASFVCADAVVYVPDECFDAIVFNEILYYFDEPLNILKCYEPYLRPDGIFITSLYRGSRRAVAIWARVKSNYALLHEVAVSTVSGKAWTCGVLAPRPSDRWAGMIERKLQKSNRGEVTESEHEER